MPSYAEQLTVLLEKPTSVVALMPPSQVVDVLNPMAGTIDDIMRVRVVVVGCGFVGSIFLEEFAKRLFAHNLTMAFEFVLVDDDKWDERNAANQNTQPEEQGAYKVDTLAEMLNTYKLDSEVCRERLTEENRELLLIGADLIVDAVDNYPTRKLIWEWSHVKNVAVMHIGVSQAGTGCVDWTWGSKWDNWALSPLVLGSKVPPIDDIKELPPCELVTLRGLGLNIGFAAAKAAAIFFGHDAEKHVRDTDDPFHAMSSWTAFTQGHELLSVVLYDEEKQSVVREVIA